MSIIIIGVGDADFDEMAMFQGDITPLFSKKMKKYRKRDIVQFIHFKKLGNDPDKLAKEVLSRIPSQLVQYFTHQSIKPNPKKMEERKDIIIGSQLRNGTAQISRKPDDFFMT
mmetsp:Transcript_28336/g.42904  ORF Transcript_28336/g.42904 Transcript_28336/m.42904 type:complete len:113 (+) Transcript_28336:178-516(+)